MEEFMLPGKDCFFELIGNPIRSYCCSFSPQQTLPLHSRLHTFDIFLFFVAHIVFSLESKNFLTKPQQKKAGFYKAKNEKNTTHGTHDLTHISKSSHFLSRLFL